MATGNSPSGASIRAFFCVGMGHAHAGRVRTGYLLLLAMVAMTYASFVAWAYVGGAPVTVALVVTALGLWLGQWYAAGQLNAVELPRADFLRSSSLFLLCALCLMALVGRALVRPFLVEAWKIPQAGMVPTLLPGDHVFATKTGLASPERGAVVIFRDHPVQGNVFVQRVVGGGGDRVEVRRGSVVVNGKQLLRRPCRDTTFEPQFGKELSNSPLCSVETSLDGREYQVVQDPEQPRADVPEQAVPEGHLFVVGDNRDHSYDSRDWGPLPVGAVIGIARRIWSSFDTSGGARSDRVGLQL